MYTAARIQLYFSYTVASDPASWIVYYISRHTQEVLECRFVMEYRDSISRIGKSLARASSGAFYRAARGSSAEQSTGEKARSRYSVPKRHDLFSLTSKQCETIV